ncbi:MAG: hypothetical protein IIV16_02405 [Alistipes sp.]|nr:hypothetical protein [Alistipes sp.]
MLVAIISYILLNLFLALAKSKGGSDTNDSRRAEAMAKAVKIVDAINRFVALWFKFLLVVALIIFAVATVASIITILGIVLEIAWVSTVELWEFGTIEHIVGEYGMPTIISSLSLSIFIFGGLFYLCLWLLIKLIRKKSNKL